MECFIISAQRRLDNRNLRFVGDNATVCIQDNGKTRDNVCVCVSNQPSLRGMCSMKLLFLTLHFCPFSDPVSASAVLTFEEIEIRALEGQSRSACIILESLTGQLIVNAMIGFTVSQSDAILNRQSVLVNLTQALVGESIFCRVLSSAEDFLVAGDEVFDLTAFASVAEPDSISFRPGGDRANATFFDNDGMLINNAAFRRCLSFIVSLLFCQSLSSCGRQ